MISRKYAGVVFGLVLSLLVVSTVAADVIGPNKVTNASPGWNTLTYPDHTSGTTWFDIRYCQSSDSTLEWELMRHWWGLPSTGLGKKNRVVRIPDKEQS